MKKQFFILALALLPLIGAAQNDNDHRSLPSDTTLIVKGRKYIIREADKKLNIKVYGKTQRGDTIADDMIYEATFNDEQTTERRFEFSMPFQKKTRKGPHVVSIGTGIYLGYTQFNSNFGFGGSNDVDLNSAKSWEIGIGISRSRIELDATHHWNFIMGLDWGYRSFRLDGDYAFLTKDNVTSIVPGTADNVYTESRLRYNFLRLPLLLDWNIRWGRRFHISAGIEPEWRYCIKSKAKVNGNDSRTIDSGLEIYPIGLNVTFEARYGDIGFYGRCATTQLFKSGKGPKLYPSSFGIVWHW